MTDRRIEGLTAWYQPIVDLNTGKVVGCEVLSRIVGADGRGGSAAALMNELEQEPEVQYALIRKLLESIRREIVPIFARHPDFYVSVNIPPSVFGTGRIAPLLSSLDLDPWRTRLVVELTERQALCDLGRAAIRNARSLGIAVALDDFGTGHSGLSQFVGLAAALRLRTVAEGVETWEHAFFLRAAGVDYGQGFYWSKAVPGVEIEALLARGFAHSLDRPPAR